MSSAENGRLYEDIDRWRVALIDADLCAASLKRRRDDAVAEADTIRQVVRSIESLERRRALGVPAPPQRPTPRDEASDA